MAKSTFVVERRNTLKRIFGTALGVLTYSLFGVEEARAEAVECPKVYNSPTGSGTCKTVYSPPIAGGFTNCAYGYSPNLAYELYCTQCQATNLCNPTIECCGVITLRGNICNSGYCACYAIYTA
jgi:hypothetical protein